MEAIIQALSPRSDYIYQIDLTNIISGSKMYCMSWKNNNNFVWKDYNLPIETIDVYINKYIEP